MRDGCPFCDYEGPSDIVSQGETERRKDADGYWFVPTPWYVIHPIAPVTSGHLLVVPTRHVADFRDDPHMLGELMEVAAGAAAAWPAMAGHDDVTGCNLIVSAGGRRDADGAARPRPRGSAPARRRTCAAVELGVESPASCFA